MEFERVVRLLLAAQIREIAAEHRRRAANKEFKVKPDGMPTADAFAARFALLHPLTEFTESAVKELAEIEAIASATLSQ